MIRQRTRPSIRAVFLALLPLTGVASGSVVRAQELPWLPKGQVRLDFAPTFWTWDSRYGIDASGAKGVETLGSDLTANPMGSEILPDLRDLEASLAEALGDDSYRVRLGAGQAVIDQSRLTFPLRLEVGVTDRLMVGGMVPFHRPRTEMVFVLDTLGTSPNVGLSPMLTGVGAVTSFVSAFETALEAAQETHSGDPSVLEAQAFLEAVSSAYAHESFFPTEGSPASDVLQARMTEIRESLGALGITGLPELVPVPPSSLTQAEFDNFLDGDLMRAAPLENYTTPWSVGDVELTAAFRVLRRGFEPDSLGNLPPVRFQVGAGLLLRLGTGTQANFNRLFALQPADGQMDLEGSVFGLVEAGTRFGAWGRLRYGIQAEGEIIKRIAAPQEVLPAWKKAAPLYRTPGNYLEVDLNPRYFLTPSMTFGVRYHLWWKGEDRYELQPLDPEVMERVTFPPTDLLNQETGETLNELGISLTYSTVAARARGEASMPIYLRATYFQPVGGGGGQTPKGGRFEAGLAVYRTLWGGSPTPPGSEAPGR